VGSTPCLLYTILCVVFEARVINLCDRDIVTLMTEEDLLFEMWERCNNMVVSWIQNAVSTDIKHTLAFVDDAQMVWTELKDRFTQQNGPRIFQLRSDLATLRQDRDSVSTYFGNL